MIQATARAGTFVHVFEEHSIFYVLVLIVSGAEATLARTSETSPFLMWS